MRAWLIVTLDSGLIYMTLPTSSPASLESTLEKSVTLSLDASGEYTFDWSSQAEKLTSSTVY